MISKPAILEFAERHQDALAPPLNWYRITKRADWSSLAAVRSDFAHADIVGRRTVFNIHGNNYRLITRVNYKTCKYLPTSNTARDTGSNEHDD